MAMHNASENDLKGVQKKDLKGVKGLSDEKGARRKPGRDFKWIPTTFAFAIMVKVSKLPASERSVERCAEEINKFGKAKRLVKGHGGEGDLIPLGDDEETEKDRQSVWGSIQQKVQRQYPTLELPKLTIGKRGVVFSTDDLVDQLKGEDYSEFLDGLDMSELLGAVKVKPPKTETEEAPTA